VTLNVNVPGFVKLSVGEFSTENEILKMPVPVSQVKSRVVLGIMLSFYGEGLQARELLCRFTTETVGILIVRWV